MRRRTVHLSFGIVAAILGAVAIWCAVQLHNAQRINAAIAAAGKNATAHNSTLVSTVPQAQLAQAITLAQAGKFTAAMKAYKALLDAPDEVRLPALYDLGNLNMREALKNGPGEAQRALPLIELAKQSYRDNLRSNPGDWDARYNLERALWLSPEYDDPILQRNQAPVHAEHATSTVQGAQDRPPVNSPTDAPSRHPMTAGQPEPPSAPPPPLTWARSALDADGRAILLALVLLLIALFVPPIPLKHDTYESLVIFDITQSMDVEDYDVGNTPVSRLKFARDAAKRALRELPCGSKVGWGAFAGYRTLILLAPVEVCENYGDLLTSLAKVDGSMRWENASEITKGVYWSMRAAKELGSNPNIIFVTDGQEAPPIDPTNILPMFDDLKAGQVRGWLVGAGGYVPRPIPKTDEDGNRVGFWRADEVMQPGDIVQNSKVRGAEHLSALREPHLQEVARQVGFGYEHLRSPETLARAMLDKRFARREKALTDLYWIPALLALVLLAARFSPIRFRNGGSRSGRPPSAVRSQK